MKKWKVLIDILLFIVTVSLFDIELIGNLSHEVLGIGISILIVIHLTLNIKWIKQVTKNFKKTNLKTKVMYMIDLLTLLIYGVAIICGMLVSHKLFNFHMSSNLVLILVHIILGRLAIIIMFVHLGIHLDRILRKVTNHKIEMLIYMIYIIVVLLIAIYFGYTLTHSFQWLYMFGKNNW